MKIKKGSIFIATPTHICKRYCSMEFCVAAIESAVKPFEAKFFVAGNSKSSCKIFYNFPEVQYFDVKLDQSYYSNKEAIHSRLTKTANWLRSIFLTSDCEYYLSLESDVILQGRKQIEAMIDHQKPVLHTNCYPGFNASPEFCSTDRVTMGCTLIQRDVVEAIEFRYDPTLLAAHYDSFFAHDCIARGIPMFYDPNITPVHLEDRLPGRGWSNLPEEER